jgi:tetratricopeptide (TPR) repeat protein
MPGARRGNKVIQIRETRAGGRASASGNAHPAAWKLDRSQMDCFEGGIRLFQAHQYRQALELFQAAQNGPDRTVAHCAGSHARMCEGRLQASAAELKTPEDHYNYAVALMNLREFGAAHQHLQIALEGNPLADHVLYALAACESLAGDLRRAYVHLSRAIDLQPANRRAARQDPDFSAAIEWPVFRRLFHPDEK